MRQYVYPGGHGPMWDLAEDKDSVKLIESFLAAGKTVAVVCHSTGALRHVKTPDGKPLVHGKEVTGFTNGEEEDVGLTKVVPFLVEDEMLKLGAVFSKTANWGVHVVTGAQRRRAGPGRDGLAPRPGLRRGDMKRRAALCSRRCPRYRRSHGQSARREAQSAPDADSDRSGGRTC